MFTLVLLRSLTILWITFKVEMTKEKTDFIHINEKHNFCGIDSFIYYKRF